MSPTTSILDGRVSTTVFRPEHPGNGWWVGAPAVTRRDDTYYLTYRNRAPSRRGYRTAIATSLDGVVFQDIWDLFSTAIGRKGTKSLERSCLRFIDGTWHLWTCWLDSDSWLPAQDRWEIWHMGADSPDAFDIATATLAMSGDAVDCSGGVKDPVVIDRGRVYRDDRYVMYFVGWHGRKGAASTFCAVSADGNEFSPLAQPVIPAGGWGSHEARLSDAVLLPDDTYLGMVDHSPAIVHNTVERVALLKSPDGFAWPGLSDFEPLRPWSDHLSRRYPSTLIVGDEARVYFERELTDGSHDLSVVTVPLAELSAALNR